jgi:hypothetical protein
MFPLADLVDPHKENVFSLEESARRTLNHQSSAKTQARNMGFAKLMDMIMVLYLFSNINTWIDGVGLLGQYKGNNGLGVLVKILLCEALLDNTYYYDVNREHQPFRNTRDLLDLSDFIKVLFCSTYNPVRGI